MTKLGALGTLGILHDLQRSETEKFEDSTEIYTMSRAAATLVQETAYIFEEYFVASTSAGRVLIESHTTREKFVTPGRNRNSRSYRGTSVADGFHGLGQICLLWIV